MSWFKKFPLAAVIAWGTVVLGALVVVQGSGLLHGRAAHWIDVVAGIIQLALTALARQHVTPLADPRDADGRRLAPPAGHIDLPSKW